jgi:hypothetical protein
VGVSDAPDHISARQQEVRARLDVLDGLGGDPLDHPQQLDRVLAGTDRLMELLDEAEAVTAQRRRWVAFGLLVLAAVLILLVVLKVVPPLVLLGAVLVLAAAAALLASTRNAPAAGS